MYRVLSEELKTFRIKHIEPSSVVINVKISIEIVKGGFSMNYPAAELRGIKLSLKTIKK